MGTVRPDAEAVAYRGPPLPNVPEDLVVPNVLSLDFDERLWVPQAKASELETEDIWPSVEEA